MAVSDAESRRGELEIGEEDERRRVADYNCSISLIGLHIYDMYIYESELR